MKKFKQIIAGLLCTAGLLGATASLAAGGGAVKWDKAPVDVSNLPSLQNGVKLFANYCLNCHSAAFMRYNRLQDIGLTEQQIKDNLLFSDKKIGETMEVAMTAKQGKTWFGTTPPDLTLIARSRAGAGGSGADYLYTYMRSFYRDPASQTGWNNTVFNNVAMPHVLWELQGERKPVFEVKKEGERETHVFTGKWEQVTPGTMEPALYDQAVGDLVNYLQWMGEPAQKSRKTIGAIVLAFLAVFAYAAWRLNAAYWKDVK